MNACVRDLHITPRTDTCMHKIMSYWLIWTKLDANYLKCLNILAAENQFRARSSEISPMQEHSNIWKIAILYFAGAVKGTEWGSFRFSVVPAVKWQSCWFYRAKLKAQQASRWAFCTRNLPFDRDDTFTHSSTYCISPCFCVLQTHVTMKSWRDKRG